VKIFLQRVCFDWEGNAENVSVVIQPDWDKPIPLIKNNDFGLFFLYLDLPLGIYEYKFIVDGKWTYHEGKPYRKNDNPAFINNYIEILPGKQIDNLFLHELPFRYLLYLPVDYPNDFLVNYKPYPLILFLHGSQMCGSSTESLKRYGLAKELEEISIPFFVISPLCPYDYAFLDRFDVLLELIDYITSSHRIDSKRVFVTGIDKGGMTSWKLAIKCPHLISAIAPISGMKYEEKIEEDVVSSYDVDMIPPVWYFYCWNDTNQIENLEIFDMLKHVDEEKFKVTRYESDVHDHIYATYSNPELLQWFLKYTV